MSSGEEELHPTGGNGVCVCVLGGGGGRGINIFWNHTIVSCWKMTSMCKSVMQKLLLVYIRKKKLIECLIVKVKFPSNQQ